MIFHQINTVKIEHKPDNYIKIGIPYLAVMGTENMPFHKTAKQLS